MMRLRAALISAIVYLPFTLCIFADDAYHIDYQHALLGIPLEHSTFFHRPQSSSNASLLYTLSEKSVLGAVNPKDGSLVWRQYLASSTPSRETGQLRAGDGENVVVSTVGGDISAWDALDGRLIWSANVGDDSVEDLEILELEEGSVNVKAKDVIVLHSGKTGTVRRFDGSTGRVKWEFSGDSGDLPYQVTTSTSTIYYVSLHASMLGGFKIKVTSLDLQTGKQTKQYTLSSESEVASPASVLFVGANTAAPVIVWTDKSYKTLKINVLGSSKICSIVVENSSGEDIKHVKVHAPSCISSSPHFLVHYRTATKGWAEVFHTDPQSAAVTKAYSLPTVQENDQFSTSSRDANVYFTRITNSEVTVVSSASHGILGRWSRADITSEGISQAVSEVVARGKTTVAVRIAQVYDSGDWELVRNGEGVWSRAEMLAGVAAADWADLGLGEALVHELEVEGAQGVLGAYIHRVKRHINGMQDLPNWLQTLPQRMMSGFFHSNGDEQQSFFKGKTVIVATDSGWVAALDASKSGQVVWRQKVADIRHSDKWDVNGIVVTGGTATLYFEDGSTIVLDISNGRVTSSSPAGEPLKTFAQIPDPISPVTLKVRADGTPSYSGTPDTNTYLVTLSNDGRALGWSLGATSNNIWEFRPAPGFKLLGATARPAHDPVASVGKVLGNRSVLYKYLSPNLALLTAASKTTIAVYLIEAVTGQILYTSTHTGVDPSLPISSAMSENWFAYSFFGDTTPSSSLKAHQLVVSELYESEFPNFRGELGEAANYSSISAIPIPHVISQAFIIPEPISHMTVTQSSQGITTRQLLCALPESNAIIGLPRYLLDPRRPVGRDPTANEAEEGLLRYAPLLEFDPKFYLTHAREVIGIKKIITTYTMLESTGLVFAYGLDIFGTRVAPSQAFDILGKGFNKLSLVATVAALAAGVAFLGPMVRKRQVDTRWNMM